MIDWLNVVLFFLGASVFLYVLLAGADFGGGIVELFVIKKLHKEQQKVISHAIAPVWEANHVWLIVAVVILFVGFPSVYIHISTYFHIPVLAVLVGIVARGCAFTFRHYDTFDNRYQKIYSRVFSFSSLWTSFFLGVLTGAFILSRIHPQSNQYGELFIAPWLNMFSFCVGLLTCCLFAFLAAVYLVGETDDVDLRHVFIGKIRITSYLMLVAGFIVFIAAEMTELHFSQRFFSHSFSVGCFISATVLVVILLSQIERIRSSLLMRSLGASIVGLVVLGWYAMQFPIALRIHFGKTTQLLTFADLATGQSTLQALALALIFGSFLIFPSLFYLLKIFK